MFCISGGCKHAIAVLAWLHRRSEDPSSTSVECYWKKSILSSVGTSLKLIKAKDIGEVHKGITTQTSFLSSLINYSKEVGDTESQLMKYYNEPNKFQKLSIHYLVCMVQNKPNGANEFIEFCKQNMQTKACEEAALETRKQSECPLWHELRYARITASKAYEAAHCKIFDGSLTDTIMGASKVKDTHAMKRGKLLEKEVIKTVEKVKKIKICRSGLILSPLNPIMGASSDGESSDYTIEVKCPTSRKNFSRYINKNNITAKYMAQVQMQMHLSNKTKTLFCVAHSDFELTKNVTILEVKQDEELIKTLVERCEIFWCNAIYPILFRKH